MSKDFLSELATNFSAMERRARDRFGAMSEEQLNRNRPDGGWSIGQCLDHLVTSNEPYFAILESVAARTKRSTVWQRLPFLPKLFGDAVLKTVHPDTVRKSKAPRIFHPRTDHIPTSILDTFCGQQRRLAEVAHSLRGVDLDKTIVTSPVAVFITYSVRHALQILDAHEERHLRQAERVLSTLPGGN